MKPERQIADIYHDILAPNDGSDAATVRVIRDLDQLYAGGPVPAAPRFSTLLATRARAPSRNGADDGSEALISGLVGGGAPPHSRSGWLQQGFAFAGAAIAFALVATILVLLFREGDEGSTPGAQPTSVPAVTATANEILYIGPGGDALSSYSPEAVSTRVILVGDGELRSPVWSPDGTRVAFSGLVDDQNGVFVVNINGEGLRLVAEGGPELLDIDIAWSPDGSQLAYRRVDAAGTTDQYIYVVNADGSNLRRLNDGGQVGAPTWSPDNQRLALTQSAPWRDGTVHNLVTVDLRSGETRQLTDGTNVRPNPQWSPDGQLVLFAAGADNVRDLLTIFADNGAPNSGLTVLIDANENETGGKWSPDGQMIAFYSNRDGQPGIWVVNADGSNPRRVVAISGSDAKFDWSPDGLRIAYVTDPGRNLPYRLFSVRVDGEDTQLHADDLHHTTQPDWSPIIASSETPISEPTAPATANSDQIAFTSIRDGNPEIYLINADGSGLTRLTDDPAADREPAWSPDGSQIAFVSDRDGEQRLYVMNADGSNARLVTDEASGIAVPVWSPDGEWIAFVAFTEAGFLDIFIVRPGGTDLRQLTDWQGIDTSPAWSPTSEQIVFTSDSDGSDSVFVVNIDGTGRASLSSGTTAGREPDWSLDGAGIVFASPSQPVIADGVNYGMLETIAFYDTASSGGSALLTTDITGSTPRWSPDGRYVAYRNPDFDPNVPSTSSETLHIVQADGLETGRIPGIDGATLEYDWSPSGEALAVAVSEIDANRERTDARALWLAQLDGSAPTLLAEQLDTWARPAWRPDPSRTPEPSTSPPDLALPTATPDTREPSEPLTPNALDNLAPLQPGQERHFVFDIRADYRLDESSFLAWNVKGSERMLPDGTLQQYVIARDASNTVLIEYVNDGKRWWWNQRGWIEGGATASGIAELPEELRVAMMEQHNIGRVMTEGFDRIDERTEGEVQITRYRLDNMEWIEQQLGLGVESAYYEVHTTGDPSQVTRTRTVLVTPDDERPEYALADVTYESVIVIDAEGGPGNYVVPEPLAEGTLQYTPPATLPDGLTIENHWREFPGGMERMQISGSSGIRIDVNIYPSRGGHDPRPMENLARMRGGLAVGMDEIAGGTISWFEADGEGWPTGVAWDNGRYRLILNITNVTSLEQWNEDDLVTLITVLAGEQPD